MNNNGPLNEYVSSFASKYPDKLKVVHINPQSLNNNNHFSEFSHAFSDSGADIAAVSKTFFKESRHMDLPNYNVFNCNRLSRMGGGVAVYVSVKLPAKVLHTSSSDGYSPYIFLEIKCNGDNILFVCMYRPRKTGHMDLFVAEYF